MYLIRKSCPPYNILKLNTNFFYRSRKFSKKNEVAKCLTAWILYVFKILTLILDINLGILLFPLKLADSIVKFLKKIIAEPLISWIMYLYKILTMTYWDFVFFLSLFVGHKHAFHNSKMKLLNLHSPTLFPIQNPQNFRCLKCPFVTEDSSAMIDHHLHAHSSYPIPI